MCQQMRFNSLHKVIFLLFAFILKVLLKIQFNSIRGKCSCRAAAVEPIENYSKQNRVAIVQSAAFEN